MKILKPPICLLLILLMSASKGVVLNLTPDELIAEQQKGTVIIDIRTPQEWAETGTIKNAKRIMFFNQQRQPVVEQFMAEFEKFVSSKDQSFILVCRSGSRTNAVTNFLDKKLGFSQGAHLAKGMKQWIAEKKEVEK